MISGYYLRFTGKMSGLDYLFLEERNLPVLQFQQPYQPKAFAINRIFQDPIP